MNLSADTRRECTRAYDAYSYAVTHHSLSHRRSSKLPHTFSSIQQNVTKL
jgi:hypothetical protein